MTPAPSSPWLAMPPQTGNCLGRLFCFPFAGGGAGPYYPWRPLLGSHGIHVCGVQLPGRETRINEPFVRTMAGVVSPICNALRPYCGAPFAFFGHSMGALIAFEVTRELRRRGLPLPQWLLISGAQAPHRRKMEHLHLLPRKEFLATLAARYGGLTDVLACQEVVDLLAPILQADFELVERHRHESSDPLPVRIAAFGGTQDEWAPAEELHHWREHTLYQDEFRATAFDGDHFFLIPARKLLTAAIAALWTGSGHNARI